MIALDPEGTTAGAMERVFIAETLSPARSDYDEVESLRCMRFMRQVIDNRLNSHNPQYGAPRGAKDQTDVIAVESQFKGFGKYPTLPRGIERNISEAVAIANAASDRRAGRYATFVNNAILAATETSPPAEANIPRNLVGWRTANAKVFSPGANYIFAGLVQGNNFFSVLKIEPARPHTTHHHR